MINEIEVSVVIPTYNRSALLRKTVASVLGQETQTSFDVLIIDNNSTDDTKLVADSLMEQHPGKVHYTLETQQGNAYARNRGVKAAKGAIIAFVDDDVTVDSDWLTTFKTALDACADLSFVGGRVLPQWTEPLPSWLTPDHWAPLALLDYGPDELLISDQNPLGLLTANIAFRRSVFSEAGMFSPHLQRVKDRIGSMEDHEFVLRVCRHGKKGLYLPQMTARAPVESERLSKTYHRRWHTGHGHFYAIMNDPEWERSSFGLVGVPGHLYRETASQVLIWLSRILAGNNDAAFTNECKLRFFRGFFLERKRQRSRKRGPNSYG